MIRKARYERLGARTIEVRTMTNFNRENFLRDLERKQWAKINRSYDPNEMWEAWKSLLIESIDKHALLRSKRFSNEKSPWITNELRRLIFTRAYLKKKAIMIEDPQI